MGSGNRKFPSETEPFSFRDWSEVLGRYTLPVGIRERCRHEVLSFLHACKVAHAPATVAFARQYVGSREAARMGQKASSLTFYLQPAHQLAR